MKQSINIPKRHPTGTGVLKKISTGILELSHITVVLIYFKADFISQSRFFCVRKYEFFNN